MKSTLITCGMCGQHFDPAENQACRACPLKKGCQLVCCPACGYETVDINQSRLVQGLSSLFGFNRNEKEQVKNEIH